MVSALAYQWPAVQYTSHTKRQKLVTRMSGAVLPVPQMTHRKEGTIELRIKHGVYSYLDEKLILIVNFPREI